MILGFTLEVLQERMAENQAELDLAVSTGEAMPIEHERCIHQNLIDLQAEIDALGDT